MRNAVMQRYRALSEGEKNVLRRAVTPQVAAVLSKVLPEMGDMIMMLANATPQPVSALGQAGLPEMRPMMGQGSMNP
jgi:hypothetical protein